MLAVAAIQGVLLFALYKAFDTGTWPSESPLWSYPLWTLTIVAPILLLLSLESGNTQRVATLVAGFTGILALLALYTGWQAEPFGEFPVFSLSTVFALSISIACFKGLMYLQQRASDSPLTYQILFTYSWRNFLVLALAALFVLAFWLVLMLWAGLFEVIDIDVFSNLFETDWFLFPVLTMAFGVGIIIFRELTHVIDSITRLLQGLIKLLLPLVVAVATIFLLALPFSGLDVLWSTGRGTALLLWLTAIVLFFVNAVYQDGRDAAPYPPVAHALIYAGLLVLPLLSALSFYGLWLRLNQYGWTVERCWAFVVWLLLTLFSVGYAWGVVTRRAAWPTALGRVNTVMGLVVLALMLLANSPVLDFRRISLASQLARVERNEIPLTDFDFSYAHNYLARPGYLALERIKADIGDDDPELLAKIENPRQFFAARRLQGAEEFWGRLQYRPAPFEVPPSLRAKIEGTPFIFTQVGGPAGENLIVRIDADRDGTDEYLLLRYFDRGLAHAVFFDETLGGWQQQFLDTSGFDYRDVDVADTLRNGSIELREPRFLDVQIGEIRLQPR